MTTLTARHICTHLEATGFTTTWEWTGGNCRAVCVFPSQDSAYTGPRVRITHEYDPFTDDDLDGDVAGGLAICLYTGEEDDEPSAHIIDAHTPEEVTAVVTALLGRPTVTPRTGPHASAVIAHRHSTREAAAHERRKLEDALCYVSAAHTVTALAVIGHAAREANVSTVEVNVDPGGTYCVFRNARGHVIDPSESWDAWNDVADACGSIDPTYPGFLRVLYPGLDFERTQGDYGYEYRATLTVEEMIHGPSDPDEADHPNEAAADYRAYVLERWATALHAAAADAQTDAEQMREHAENIA